MVSPIVKSGLSLLTLNHIFFINCEKKMKRLIKAVVIFVFLIMVVISSAQQTKESFISPMLLQSHALQTLCVLEDTQDFKITPLSGGSSEAMVYKVDSDDKSYVIRFIQHCPMAARLREIDVQTIASEQGWGPKLYASNAHEGWVIMEYITPTPFIERYRMEDEIYRGLGRVLQKIHTGQEFSIVKNRLEEIGERLECAYKEGKIPQSISYKVLADIIDSAKKYPRIVAPTHRDLNPNNIIFSNCQPFIIDFEEAAQDDPFYDLATVGILYIFDVHHEKVFLDIYFDRVPTQQEYVHYQTMKQVAWISTGLNFLDAVPQEMVKKGAVVAEPLNKLLQDFDDGVMTAAESINKLKVAVIMLQEAINSKNNIVL